MASYEDHCAECKEKLGKDWAVVHRWLDEFFAQFNGSGHPEIHRDLRHHEGGIAEVRLKWGDQAAEAARLHIARDFHGWVPRGMKEVEEWRHGQVPPGWTLNANGRLEKIGP